MHHADYRTFLRAENLLKFSQTHCFWFASPSSCQLSKSNAWFWLCFEWVHERCRRPVINDSKPKKSHSLRYTVIKTRLFALRSFAQRRWCECAVLQSDSSKWGRFQLVNYISLNFLVASHQTEANQIDSEEMNRQHKKNDTPKCRRTTEKQSEQAINHKTPNKLKLNKFTLPINSIWYTNCVSAKKKERLKLSKWKFNNMHSCEEFCGVLKGPRENSR